MRGRMPSSLAKPAIVPVCCFAVMLITLASGCSLWRGKSDEVGRESRLRDLMKVPEPPDLLREAVVPRGLNVVQVDGVAAVNSLQGTGGPSDPSFYREQLLEEMKRNGVNNPNKFLERDDTALVLVRAFVPPGARRGDPLDVKITSPPKSRVTDLHGGWLLDTRLRHQRLLNSAVRKSEVMTMATGPVLTRANYSPGEDDALKIEGRVLGGGRVQIERKLGLILRPEYQHVKMSAALAAAINRRFFFFDGTTRRGIAKAVEDDFIEVELHPRYRDNVHRMIAVIRAISVKPESSDTQERLVDLAGKLNDPATAADAALQLEAMGESAIPTLLEGIKASNPELRFYAAEALAYLDRVEAVEPLVEAVRSVPAFRQPALLAVQGIPHHSAVEGLRGLFNESSLETRYGAFVSIRRRDDGIKTLGGEVVGDSFRVYRVESSAPPAVVVSLRETPEIVLFGDVSALAIPKFLFGPGGLILKADPSQPGKLRISRFRPGKEDQRAVVGISIDAVIRGIAAVGGGYGDAITVLRSAKDSGFLADQLAIDPLPKGQRTYYRDDEERQDSVDSSTSEAAADPPSLLTGASF